ncbi:MAG: DUF2207 domain-containing protein [Clostridia bacterium]|nr:DUF2207 domain-containing protein [Clostridia bacterium]
MRRTLNNIILSVFVFTLILCFPRTVKAGDDLIIPEWVVNAHVVETGDLKIVEDITFEFNDDFNGVFREIVLDKTSGVSDIRVEEVLTDSSKEYVQVEDAKKGDSGVFVIKEDTDKISIQVFSPSKDQQKTFRIGYIVKNVAIKYNDIGELYYKFLGDENQTSIGSFTVNIKLPQIDASNEVKIFAHGPLNGEIHMQNDATYILHVDDVPPDTFIEGRVLFPKECIPLSNNIRNVDNYSNILEEEDAYQKKLIEDRERKQAIGEILEQISIVGAGVGLVLFVLFLVLFRRQKDIYHSMEYIGIPEDCTPAVACYLTGNIISTNTIFATILDLFRKGYMKISKGEYKKGQDTDDQEYIITRVKEQDDSLLNHEKHFINWLIDEMGNGQSVSTNDIEQFGKHNSTKFIDLYAQWKGKIREDAVQKGYYDKSKTKFGVFFLILSLVLFILSIFTLVYSSLFGIGSLIISILLFIYSMTLFCRRSDYGYWQYKKWVHFKKDMLKHDKHLSIEGFIENSVDVSLIYALGLGVETKVDDFNFDKKNQYNQAYSNNSWIFWYLLYVNNKDNAFERSMNNSFEDIAGGSYSGGGFSGGGGGGAGGGGAGGF